MLPDDLDRRLLDLLSRDARQSAVALARALGLSRSAVQARLRRLEASGGIARYTIERGDPGAGPLVVALVALKISVRPCDLVLRQIRQWPEFAEGWSVGGGETDAVIRVTAGDTGALAALMDRLKSLPGVERASVWPVLARMENSTIYL